MEKIITLEKPVMHGNSELSSLALREVTTEDIIALGMPYSVGSNDDDELVVTIKPKGIARYVSKLGAVPPSIVSKLAPADFFKCQEAVMTFLGQSAGSEPKT